MIHIYCGDGKGKSSAAFGAALRAAGNGMQVLVSQFLKDGSSGELRALSKIENVTILTEMKPNKFLWDMNQKELEETREIYHELFAKIGKISEDYQVIILDEIVAAYQNNMVDRQMFLEFLKEQKENREIILTGRNPAPELLELADYITEMNKVRHPFDKGVQARKGIEF